MIFCNVTSILCPIVRWLVILIRYSMLNGMKWVYNKIGVLINDAIRRYVIFIVSLYSDWYRISRSTFTICVNTIKKYFVRIWIHDMQVRSLLTKFPLFFLNLDTTDKLWRIYSDNPLWARVVVDAQTFLHERRPVPSSGIKICWYY